MTAYSIFEGWVGREITGVNIDGKSYSIDQIKAALSASHPVQGWQDTDSAPKDGTRVLIFEPGKPIAIASYNPTSWQWSNRYRPTLWMPLPAGPSSTETAK